MDTSVYFSTEFFNENSPIFQAESLIQEPNGTKLFNKIEGSNTTLSTLTSQGWRLIQVIHIDDLLSVQLFLEKD